MEHFWVICKEGEPHLYWCPGAEMTKNPAEATRFTRDIDANSIISVINGLSPELSGKLNALRLSTYDVHPTTRPPSSDPTPEPILRFFAYEHLPAALKVVSTPFGDLARDLHATLPRNAERSVALRKLLEAKDAAVRAAL